MSSNEFNYDFFELRERIFNSFRHRKAALTGLIDSLCSNTTADSPTKLSLNPLFQRGYSSITDAVDAFGFSDETNLARIAAPVLEPQEEGFYFFGVD